MANIEIYTTTICPYCHRAKAALDQLGLDYTEYSLSAYPEKTPEMVARSGRRTVPQVFVDGRSIGGSDDLLEMIVNGEFFELLNVKPVGELGNAKEIGHVA